MADKNEFTTPVGRLVGGSPFEPQTKDMQGNPLKVKSGANAGQDRVDYFMAVAIPKTDPEWPAIKAMIDKVASEGFPHLFPEGNCIQPTFAFKITDGDSVVPNKRGYKPCDREGYPGHWVLSFGGGFAPKCKQLGSDGKWQDLLDPTSIQRGFYVRVYGTVASNQNQEMPGVYLNGGMVQFVAYGPPIISGPDAEAVFGSAPIALPAGASATPVAPVQTIAQTTAPVAGPATAAPAVAAPAVTPAPDFVAGPATAAPAGSPVPLQQPTETKYQAPDGVFTFAQLTAAGYAPEQIAALPQVA